MLRDITNQKKIDIQAVVSAIKSLQDKGWDINPYTVADEAKIQRSALYRSAELMDLVSAANGGGGGSNELLQRIAGLEQSKIELEHLVKQLSDDNQKLAVQQQEAWQIGYQVGYAEANAGKPSAVSEQSGMKASPTQLIDNQDNQDQLSDQDIGAMEPAAEEPEEHGPQPSLHQEKQLSSQEQAAEIGIIDATSNVAPLTFSIDIGSDVENEVEPEFVEHAEESNQQPQLQSIETPSMSDEAHRVSQDELRDLLQHRFSKIEPDQEKPVKSSSKPPSTKFVGSNRPIQEPPPKGFVIRNVSADVRKACMVLGLRPEELTRKAVHQAWKHEIANPGTHPDLGGDTEIAVYLNTAKDTLFAWLDAQAPKLGEQFRIKPANSVPPKTPSSTSLEDGE